MISCTRVVHAAHAHRYCMLRRPRNHVCKHALMRAQPSWLPTIAIVGARHNGIAQLRNSPAVARATMQSLLVHLPARGVHVLLPVHRHQGRVLLRWRAALQVCLPQQGAGSLAGRGQGASSAQMRRVIPCSTGEESIAIAGMDVTQDLQCAAWPHNRQTALCQLKAMCMRQRCQQAAHPPCWKA